MISPAASGSVGETTAPSANAAGRAGTELLSDDVEYVVDYPVGPQTYIGRAGVEAYMREILAEWKRMQVEATEMVEVGDCVFVAQHQVQTGRLSGLRVEEPTAAVWKFNGDHVVRLQLFHDPAEARAAAGVSG
jgi:ketosteroid isomerase-like protein